MTSQQEMKLQILVSVWCLLMLGAVANRHNHHPGHSRSWCTVDGVTYANGTSWPSVDGCQECSCSNGLTFCVRTSVCPELGQCGISATLPGLCCPVCVGCVSPSGRRASFNETWQEDECTTCTCHEGIIRCQMPFCRPNCLHPRRVPGECCPVCDDDCPLDCLNGRERDAITGRELCQCRQATASDTTTRTSSVTTISNVGEGPQNPDSSSCPPLDCSRTCPHGLQTDRRGCPVCKCLRCKPLECHKKCPLGLVHDFRGCPLCQCQTATAKCQMDNSTYSIGERWKVSDCVSCVCHKEGPMCTETVCVSSCVSPVYVNGQCCPLCGDSSRNHLSANNDVRETQSSNALLTAVLVCVALVAGLILIIAVLALCVARQCNRLRRHEENVAAAVRLTSVSKLRPKSTNLEYQYNLYMKRYRDAGRPSCWNPMEQSDLSSETRDTEEGNSQCSNSPLLVKMEKPAC